LSAGGLTDFASPGTGFPNRSEPSRIKPANAPALVLTELKTGSLM
jgi:hypothetical protein